VSKKQGQAFQNRQQMVLITSSLSRSNGLPGCLAAWLPMIIKNLGEMGLDLVLMKPRNGLP